MTELGQTLSHQRALGMIYIDASDLCKIEYDYGHQVYQDILRQTVLAIEELKGSLIRQEDVLTIRHPSDENFLLFLSGRRDEYNSFLKMDNLQNIIDRFAQALNSKIFQLTFPYTKKILKADIGYSYTVFNPLLSTERTIYRLIEDAKQVAKFNGDRFMIRIHESLKEIIIEENIITHYQPIVDLNTGEIFAFEALSRGPKGSAMESPLMLFGVADKTNLSFELDRLCRRKAISNLSGLGAHQKLFINTFPTTMHDPEFKGESLERILESANLRGDNIVFEVTERFAIENYELFQKEQNYFSSLGFGLAVDDIGSGYGSLEAIAHLRPQYVKVDISIIREIHNNPVKQELLKAIADIARKINAKVLVEGIETAPELSVVRAFGCDYGQGYLLARPADKLLPPNTLFDLEKLSST
jgi:EAL domain-containing protein (putative c-di-GMP-specific phosphodiesterase class I)